MQTYIAYLTVLRNRQVQFTYNGEITIAQSPHKALSNFNYRAKKRLGLVDETKVICSGTILNDNLVFIVKNNRITDIIEQEHRPSKRGNKVIEQDGQEYIFDEEDNVFWLNGIKYSEYITREA